MKLSRHPILWICEILSLYQHWNCLSSSASINFSRYRYKPHSFKDERESFYISINELDKSSIFDLLVNLEDDQELALSSTIYDLGSEYHFPLIDFGGKDSKLLESTFIDFCSYWDMEFQVYSSGRSFHAYGNKILTSSEWIKFMGSLLLLNIPGASKIIDDRWVGHRILAGYSSLRWSKNTSQYKKYPTYIGLINATGFHGSRDGDIFKKHY